jgi:cytoplasmic iron level regulating protein YaaA (DUF328/UPF0246 family)
MLILLSPTKQMSFPDESHRDSGLTEPRFLQEAEVLSKKLKYFSKRELSQLMNLSEKLAEETFTVIQNLGMTYTPSGAALLSYSGTVFQHLNPQSLNDEQWKYAVSHVGILSGLYGFLLPSDSISPYRLEMKTPLGLYDFWKKRLTAHLIERDCPILNLASSEYSKVINWKDIKQPVLSLQFKEEKDKKLRTVGMYSKMARGKLAGMIIRNKLTDWNSIKEWDIGGYSYNKNESSDRQWVFSGKWRG